MPEKKESVLIFSEAEGTLLGLIRSLGPHPYKLNLLVDHCPENILISRYLSKFMKYDARLGEEHILGKLIEAINIFKPDVLITADVLSGKIVSKNYKELSKLTKVCLVPPEESISITDNKWEMAKFCREEGIPHPKTVHWTGENMGEVLDLNFPILVKPIHAVGGLGIFIIDKASKATEKLKKIKANPNQYICQEFRKGTDVGFSFYAVDGEIKYYSIQRGLVKIGPYSSASELLFEENPELFKIASNLSRSLNYSGVANVDCIQEDSSGSYFLLELNPRYWHSLAASTSMGINFPHLCIRHTLGDELRPIKQKTGKFYMRKPRLGRMIKGGYKLKETALYYELKDPLPLMANKIKFLNFVARRKRYFPSDSEMSTKPKALVTQS